MFRITLCKRSESCFTGRLFLLAEVVTTVGTLYNADYDCFIYKKKEVASDLLHDFVNFIGSRACAKI